MTRRLITVAVRNEMDVVACRQRARQIARLCGFRAQDQARISTAVSELARNVFDYASNGRIEFAILGDRNSQILAIRVKDQGPGIEQLDAILAGTYQSITGLGLGILGAKRLMDQFDISTAPGSGTTVVMTKALPADAPVITPDTIRAIGVQLAQLAAVPENVILTEVQQQNRDLIDALEDLQARQDELHALSQTLEATNHAMAALNTQLDEKASRLEKADRRKDEFLAILSHELRGPLSATGMAAQMLQIAPALEARAAQLGETIMRQVGHMSRLVEDLLDVSRMSRGLVTIDKKPVDMRIVVNEAVEQVGPFIRTKSHRVVVSMPAEACWVLGDRTRLVQVISNLLSNAVRYTPDGGHIALSVATDEDKTTITVADSGIGVSPDLLPYLFDLYVQAERSSDRKNGGLGLGLALVKSLVEAHDGTVNATSGGKDRGSTFTVQLARRAPLAFQLEQPAFAT